MRVGEAANVTNPGGVLTAAAELSAEAVVGHGDSVTGGRRETSGAHARPDPNSMIATSTTFTTFNSAMLSGKLGNARQTNASNRL